MMMSWTLLFTVGLLATARKIAVKHHFPSDRGRVAVETSAVGCPRDSPLSQCYEVRAGPSLKNVSATAPASQGTAASFLPVCTASIITSASASIGRRSNCTLTGLLKSTALESRAPGGVFRIKLSYPETCTTASVTFSSTQSVSTGE